MEIGVASAVFNCPGLQSGCFFKSDEKRHICRSIKERWLFFRAILPGWIYDINMPPSSSHQKK